MCAYRSGIFEEEAMIHEFEELASLYEDMAEGRFAKPDEKRMVMAFSKKVRSILAAHKGEAEAEGAQGGMRELLESARHALRSYENGNQATGLARRVANRIDSALRAPAGDALREAVRDFLSADEDGDIIDRNKAIDQMKALTRHPTSEHPKLSVDVQEGYEPSEGEKR
jgi:hypothetical protein